MAINTGVNTSKLAGYATLAVNPGVDASKLGGYAILSVMDGADCSKLNGYAVLSSIDTTPPSWPSVFPDGDVGIPYSFGVNALGALPITITQTAGSTPPVPGLTLTLTSNTATLAGTPTTAGTYNFTLHAVNANGSADHSFTVVISVPSIDFPAETDVRDGVTYGDGDFMGNMTEPGESDVRSGTQYGANGTEFTGSLTGGSGGTHRFVYTD